MRAVDLAVYADALAARRLVVSARLERARAQAAEAAIERAAVVALPHGTVLALEESGVLAHGDGLELASREVDRLARAVAAIDELQTWIEHRLAAALDDALERRPGGAGGRA
ncbi:MAG: hypothetical protein R3C15_16910 [Thermoleophilia bacterium]